MQVRENNIKRANEKVKDKGIKEGDLKLFKSLLVGPFSLQIWMEDNMNIGLMDPI